MPYFFWISLIFGWSSCMAAVDRTDFTVNGSRIVLIRMVKTMIARPPLPVISAIETRPHSIRSTNEFHKDIKSLFLSGTGTPWAGS